MSDKLIKKLCRPGLLIVVGVLVLAVAGIVLALCFGSEEPSPTASAPPGITEQTDPTASTDEPDTSHPDTTTGGEPDPSDPPEPTGETPPQTTGDDVPQEDDPQKEPQQTIDPEKVPTETQLPSGEDQPVTDPAGGDQPEEDTTGQTEPTDSTPPPGPVVTLPAEQEPTSSDLTVDQFAVFSGAFAEDGSDEPVQNVAAILVTNQSDQYLDMGTLIYDIDGRQATFVATGLPSGTSAWVMEASRMSVDADAVFNQTDCTTIYREDAVGSTDKVTIQSSGTMLRAVNNTDQTLKNVTVYYKRIHNDGHYFGGIAYMVTFGDLQPGQPVEKLAGHFKEGWTDIVRIGYQTEEAS